MSISNISSVTRGWSLGFTYTELKRSEDEIKQGANYLLAFPNQIDQVFTLSVLTERFSTNISNSYLKITFDLVNCFAPFISIPFIFLADCVKQGCYEERAVHWNEHSYEYLNFYTGKVAIGAMALASLTIGNSVLIYSSLLLCGYQLACITGLVSQQFREVTDNYNPIINHIYPPTIDFLNRNLQLPLTVSNHAIIDITRFVAEDSGYMTRISMIDVASFVAEHIGDMTRVCMIVEALASLYLHSMYFGIPFFLALGYEALDTAGYVPRRISIFVEKYASALSYLGMALEGSWLSRIRYSYTFLCYASPTISKLFQQVVNTGLRSVGLQFFGTDSNVTQLYQGPDLAEVDASIVVNRELTFNQINDVLDAAEEGPNLAAPINTIVLNEMRRLEAQRDGGQIRQEPLAVQTPNYSINPSHCSKVVGSMLTQDNDFDKFARFFDGVNWIRSYQYIKLKLKDDHRFLNMLGERLHITNRALVRENFDTYMQQVVAAETGHGDHYGVEAFAKDWLKEQNNRLIQVLKDERRITGSQQDLQIAIENSSRILAHLNILHADPIRNKVEIEDILLKLSVEAGNYCGRGVRRATGEIIEGLAGAGTPNQNLTPREIYELKINQKLFDQRSRISQRILQHAMGVLNECWGIQTQDVHIHDIFRRRLSFGFMPLYDHERHKMTLEDLYYWNLFMPFINAMYALYDPEAIFQEEDMGEIHFFNYIREIIETNPSLTREQKDAVIEKYTLMNDGSWTFEETTRRFHRLAFVMLGVLKRQDTVQTEPRAEGLDALRVRHIA